MTEENQETLAEYIRRIMHEKRLTRAMIGEASGLSQSNLTKYLSDLPRPLNLESETILALARGLREDPRKVFEVVAGIKPPDTNSELYRQCMELLHYAEQIHAPHINLTIKGTLKELIKFAKQHSATQDTDADNGSNGEENDGDAKGKEDESERGPIMTPKFLPRELAAS